LWFDKFCDCWCVNKARWSISTDGSGDNPKFKWIRGFAEEATGVQTQLAEFSFRLVQLVMRRGGRTAVFRSESRFVTGLGRSHPVENGFTWHPTLGTPYLPGSSIKGMVRAWAREQIEPSPDEETVVRLLGCAGRLGGVCFLDAVPVAPVRVEADVMTPHFAGWSESEPPGDWCSPTPIPFLATAAGTKFLFGVVPCVSLQHEDLTTVFDWLESALAWSGAGAKTAVGYGRMARDEAATTQLVDNVRRQQERLEAQCLESMRKAGLSPLDREFEELAQANADVAPYLAWLKAFENGRWREQPDTKRDVLNRIKTEMEQAGFWKPHSAKKRPEKDKDHQRTLLIMHFLDQNT
jgi:CRISPR-associated protein Cmr6